MDNDRLIADLDACGWFSDLSAGEADSLKAKLNASGSGETSLHLASVIIDDPDLIGGGGSLMASTPASSIASYEDLLRAYTKAASGQFKPEAIVEEVYEEESHFAIGFLAEERIYALFIPGEPHFNLEINDLVNEALAQAGAEKRFFALPTADQKVALAFITPSVFECACQMGIIPLQEDLLSELYGDGLGSPQVARTDASSFRSDPVLATA